MHFFLLEASGFGQPAIDEIKQAFFGISVLWFAGSEEVLGAFDAGTEPAGA
jgi:hypothetical protein